LKTNHNNIDHLQQSLQERFNDFEYQVAIDFDEILKASTLKSSNWLSNKLMYYIGGASIVAGILVYWTLHNQTKTAIIPKPTKVTTKEYKRDETVPTISNTPISLPTVKATTVIKTNKLPVRKSNTILPIAPSTTPIVEEQTVLLPKQTDEHENFEHFVTKKSSTTKDSLELFIKKK
jgi:hypothetical protein